jgi:hypothetical protein
MAGYNKQGCVLTDMNMDNIRELCRQKALRWTNHIMVRLIQRGIAIDDVESAVLSGEIIEQYPSDYPYPSCLIIGIDTGKQYLHVVCGIGVEELWLITAYYPSEDEWSSDFKVRKESRL